MARLNVFHICGPGLSICCSVLSIWGIIMLAIVGGLLSAQSASFIEDIPIEANLTDPNYQQAMTHGFNAAATNCYGAVGIYAVVLIFCIIQVWFNLKLAAMKQQ